MSTGDETGGAVVVEALPFAAALFDRARGLVAANAGFFALTGLASRGAAGCALADAFPAALAPFEAAAAGAWKGRVEIVRGAAFRRGGSLRLADVTFAPVQGGAGRVLVTALDAAMRRDADDERREDRAEARTRELLAAQERSARERRLAAVGQLAAGVMHDVNNALNPILAAAFLLEARADDPDAVRDYARRIAHAAEAGAASAARVGRFMRQDPPQAEAGAPVDLSELADEVCALTRPLWAERGEGGAVQLECGLAPDALVRGAAGEFREALFQLVQNALDAMPEGGRLAIRTAAHDDEVMLEVRDSGIGMTPEVRERAFEPFFSTKGARGSGLGLSEVYGIVRRHRGRVELESAPGEGTTVRLRVPRATPVVVEAVHAPPARTPRRVLLVEDHADGRAFMRTVLEHDGHAVEAVASLAEACARLDGAAGSPAFDVVITDVGLPDGSGWELVSHVRRSWPSLRCGVVTGWEAVAPKGTSCDFTLRKPIRPAELLARISG